MTGQRSKTSIGWRLPEHGYNSMWTREGKDTFELDQWWDSAQSSDSTDRLFLYDGTRIFRRGPDFQDSKVVIYRADARCDLCGVYVQEDREAFDSRRREASTGTMQPVRCIACLTGGVIGPHLFRS